MAADAGGLGQRAADAGGGRELILRRVAAKDLPDFEQSRHRESRDRRSSARRRRDPGIRLGRMSESSAAIGLASASSGLPPPNSSACFLAMNDQVTASTRLRAASARLALRVRTWIGVSTGLRGASPRSNGVGGTRSTPRMRTISSTTSALPCTSAPPRRHRDLHPLALAGDEEAEALEHAAHLRQRHREPGQALESRTTENR